MKSTPIFSPLPSAICELKLAAALRDSGIACKVARHDRATVKITLPAGTDPREKADSFVETFVAGFAAGYLAF